MRNDGTVDESGNKKMDYVNGAKGYYWLEADPVKMMDKYDDIDISYYDALVDEAIKTINKYIDINTFIER